MVDSCLSDYIISCRKYLHKIPEIGFDLYKTNKYIKDELISMGYSVEEVAKTGVVALKKGIEDVTIAFRSDMDALMVEEKNNIEYKSLHQGMMHACGHDGHMAILLGFAIFLKDKDTKYNVLFIFQPAEEGPGGAKVIVEEKVLEKYNVKYIFGLHLFPNIEEGYIGICDGAMMAQNKEIDIIIEGKSSHGAQPHLGSDAIVAASDLVKSYQTIISRNINPLEAAVITIGTINGGEARNIIANNVKLTGTIRCFDDMQYQLIKTHLEKVNKSIEVMHNVKIMCDIKEYYPPVINDSYLFDLIKTNINNYKIIKPLMLSEDFSYYQQEIPGMFMMLGTKNLSLGYTHPLHSCFFNFKDEVLIKGLELYIDILNIFEK